MSRGPGEYAEFLAAIDNMGETIAETVYHRTRDAVSEELGTVTDLMYEQRERISSLEIRVDDHTRDIDRLERKSESTDTAINDINTNTRISRLRIWGPIGTAIGAAIIIIIQAAKSLGWISQ